jgi:hypothetical protein
MSKTSFSLDPHYQTLPPQMINSQKVAPVLEYLSFSGAPIYLATQKNAQELVRLPQSGIMIDVQKDECILELAEPRSGLAAGMNIEASFGYKRKRGVFRSSIGLVEGKTITLKIPEEIKLTNLRRNPRVSIDRSLHQKHFQVEMKAHSSIGPIIVRKLELHDFSQLGMSIFVDRAEGLLLPGDVIQSLEVLLDGQRILLTSGIVSRVDMNRRSSTLPNSYELVLLFEQDEKSERPTHGDIKRAAKRTPILDTKPCFFTAEHPFFPGRPIEGQVFEISTSGLSCLMDRTPFPIIPGMRFPKARLQLPHKSEKELQFEVVHVNFKSDGEVNQFKLGGEFVTANIELLKDVTSFTQELINSKVSDLKEEDLDLLWEFLFETNFIYQNKRRQIQNNSRDILETYRKLLSHDNSIVKKVVFKEESAIKGHVSAIRFFDSAWIIQHLNALKAEGTSAALSVVQGIVDFFYDRDSNYKASTHFVMSFYRPDNLYPSILFGETARRINDKQKCITLDFSFGIFTEPAEVTKSQDAEVSIDSHQDAEQLANLLIDQGHHMLLRALGMHKANPLDLEVSKDFSQIDLYRKRHLTRASKDEVAVFALIECSSPGLNLSELTNSIFIFTNHPQTSLARGLAEKAIQIAAEQFFISRGINPVVMEPAGQTLAKNVNWSKIYTCWITSAAAVPDFEAKSSEVIQDFKKIVASRKAEATVEEGAKTGHGS